ncbi:MAG TPA: CVNH domain-containing protein [Thermoanaerobaculia bacterium]|nr:CVNH domain-containing protein [Thermoanaerobaculia bacterium]
MSKKIVCVVFVLFALVAGTAFAQGGFQNTCSNIAFAYSGNQAALTATCLRANGTPNPSTLVLQGIGNQNGKLVQGSGASTFQQSCGNIQITATASQVTLSALCRTSSGGSNATSLPLNGIKNNNGTLSY